MPSGQHSPHTAGKPAHHRSRPACNGQAVDKLTTVVHPAEHRMGNGDAPFRISSYADAARLIVHAHHLEIGGVDADALPAWVSALREKAVVHLFAYHAHLALLTHVHSIECTSVAYFGFHHPCEVVVHTHHRDREIVFVTHRLLVAAKHKERHHIQFGHLLAQALHVAKMQGEATPLAQSLVGFGGGLGPNHGRVGGKTGKVLLEHLPQPPATSQQHHQHQHAPEHAEAREQAAALVTGKRVQYLVIGVQVDAHVGFSPFCRWFIPSSRPRWDAHGQP